MAQRSSTRTPTGPSERRPSDDGRLGAVDMLELWPLAARMGIVASLRAAEWATSSSLAVGRRVASALRNRESPAHMVADARAQVLDAAREALGINDLDETLDRIVSDRPKSSALRQRGQELLADSASVGEDNDQHPAFASILEELAPDEVRLLRLLAAEGEQASIDVQSVGPLGGRARTVARRLTILPGKAGCRHPERIQLYLDNLLRLSLTTEAGDPLEEEQAYDVLSGDPAVWEAEEAASSGGTSRAKLVRGSIALSEFGRSFCEACLPGQD